MPKKVIFTVFALLVAAQLWSQTLTIDKSTGNSRNVYYVIFHAYPRGTGTPTGKSNTGHAYVEFFRQVGNTSESVVKGMHPGEGWNLGLLGELHDDKKLISLAQMTLAVQVDEDVYQKAIDISKLGYFPFMNDCISYAREVADIVKLNVPFRITGMFPMDFLDSLQNNNRP